MDAKKNVMNFDEITLGGVSDQTRPLSTVTRGSFFLCIAVGLCER